MSEQYVRTLGYVDEEGLVEYERRLRRSNVQVLGARIIGSMGNEAENQPYVESILSEVHGDRVSAVHVTFEALKTRIGANVWQACEDRGVPLRAFSPQHKFSCFPDPDPNVRAVTFMSHTKVESEDVLVTNGML